MLLCTLFISRHSFAQDEQTDTTVTTEVQVDSSTVEADTATSEADTPVVDSIIFRAVPDTTVARLKRQKDFAYANDPSYWAKPKEAPPPRIVLFKGFQYVFLGIFIAVLIYIIAQVLMKNKILLFKRNKKFGDVQEGEENEEHTDLHALISQAESAGNLRMAARYRYLNLLNDLNERKLITLHNEKTNWDYVRQMNKHPQYDKFRYLTLAYDYVWYGEIQPTAEQYGVLKKNFESFLY
jgi:hypothetical protein